jgi:lactoylglutathione lyase
MAKNTFLHTCYRIGDIDRSIAFYEKLGFADVGRLPIGDEAVNIFMAIDDGNPILELTHNFGVHSYDHGTGYNHIALKVSDIDATLAELAEQGVQPEKAPYIAGGRTTGNRIAFVRDPDNCRIELVEHATEASG